MGVANVNIARDRFRELEWVLKGLVIPYGRVGVGKYSSLVVTKLKHWVPEHWDTDVLHCNCGVKVHSQKTPISTIFYYLGAQKRLRQNAIGSYDKKHHCNCYS